MQVVKGQRIRARWFVATGASLAGASMKVGAEEHTLTGTIRHIRGDHPTHPTVTRVYVESDDGLGDPCGTCQVREVALRSEWITEVL